MPASTKEASVEGWFWFWLLFVVVLLLLPLAYGWGLRGWGPPNPRRRRSTAAQTAEAAGETWGALAVVLWFAFVAAIVWLLAALIL
jgi:ABC-type Fe3+ transport system permease subunit